ncbi:MAG: TadE family protein [Planctomycetota bacterium]
MTVFDVGALAAIAIGLVAAARLALRAGRRGLAVIRPSRDERGSIAVEFVLLFVPFLLMCGAVVQTALLAHAALIVRYAAFKAARVAVVHTDRGFAGLGLEEVTNAGERKAREAAAMVLAPIAARSSNTGPSWAADMEQLRSNQGTPWTDTVYDRRVRFALDALEGSASGLGSRFQLEEIDPEFTAFNSFIPLPAIPNPVGPRQVRARVVFPVRLVAPGIASILAPTQTTISGNQGHYFDIVADLSLQSSGPRDLGAIPLLISLLFGPDSGIGRPF